MPRGLIAWLGVVAVAVGAAAYGAPGPATKPLWLGMDLFTEDGNGSWSDPSGLVSVEQIAQASGSNTIAIVPTWFQYRLNSTSVESIPHRSFGRDDVAAAAAAFRGSMAAGASRVILKPHVDCLCGTWRAKIGTEFTEEWQWQQWFQSYTAYMSGMASIAAELKLDGLVIGTEMIGTSARESDWRKVVAACRKAFPGGTLIYGANWGDEPWQVQWWDAVDVIGVDAYYPLAHDDDPPLAELLASWPPVLANLSALSAKWAKPILFTEIGYRSYAGAAKEPGVYQGNSPPDMQAQVNLFQALAQAVLADAIRPAWLQGVLLWSWSNDPRQGGLCDDGYSPHRKPAETVIRTTFSALTSASQVATTAAASSGVGGEQALAVSSIGNTSIYSNGVIDQGWQSWSYNGKFDTDDKVSPTLPGHKASFQASQCVPFGGISMRGVLPSGAPEDGLNATTLLSVGASLQFHVRGAEPGADLSVGVCYCDDCGSSCNITGSSRAIKEFLPKQQACNVPTAWSTPAQAAASLVTIPITEIIPLAPAGSGPRISPEAVIRRIAITNHNDSAPVSFWVDDIQITVPQD